LPTFYIASTPVYEGMVTGRVLERSNTLDEAMNEALATLVESS